MKCFCLDLPAVTCPAVVTPIKAVLLTPSCKSTYGSRCTYSCQTGYTSSTGNVTRTCLASGQWSGNEIICKGNKPPNYPSYRNKDNFKM